MMMLGLVGFASVQVKTDAVVVEKRSCLHCGESCKTHDI